MMRRWKSCKIGSCTDYLLQISMDPHFQMFLVKLLSLFQKIHFKHTQIQLVLSKVYLSSLLFWLIATFILSQDQMRMIQKKRKLLKFPDFMRWYMIRRLLECLLEEFPALIMLTLRHTWLKNGLSFRLTVLTVNFIFSYLSHLVVGGGFFTMKH